MERECGKELLHKATYNVNRNLCPSAALGEWCFTLYQSDAWQNSTSWRPLSLRAQHSPMQQRLPLLNLTGTLE